MRHPGHAGRTLAILALAALARGHADAATLRPQVTLTAATVKLSDLFDDAGPEAARVLGPGPAPGGQIVVEAPQLAAIAHQFGVDWHPASAADRAVLNRAGRPLRLEEVLDVLRPALRRSGAGPDSDIDLPGFSAPMLPADSIARPVVEQLSYDAANGRFTAQLSVGDDGRPVRLRVAGRAQDMVVAPVPTRRLPTGTILRPEDLRLGRIPASLVTEVNVTAMDQAIGMQLQHQAIAGQPLPLADLGHPPLVLKGATVTMLLEEGALSLAARGEAMEPGAPGETIRVLNPLSRAVVLAQVSGPNQVRVTPDSNPIQPATRSAQAALQ